MKTTKFKGYISVLLIILIGVISSINLMLYINTNIKTKTIENNFLFTQSKYISESYLRYFTNSYIEDESVNFINLFPELNHDINYNIDESNSEKVIIDVKTNYEDIETKMAAEILKFNEIFYSGEAIINSNNIQGRYIDSYNKFKDSIETGIIYNDENIVRFEPNDKISKIGGRNYISREIDGNIVNIDMGTPYHFEFNNITEIGDDSSGLIRLHGTFYSDGEIILNTSVIFDGIFISNNGKIINNGNSYTINGILIETGENGSYANAEIKYSKISIDPLIETIENAKEYKVIRFKTVD